MKRSRVSAMSEARRIENHERRTVTMPFVRERDRNRCVGQSINPATGEPYILHLCFGDLNGHEIITRGDGGSITDPGNVVLVCDWLNEWCTRNKDEAVKAGFRQVRTDPYSSRVADRLPHLSAGPSAPPSTEDVDAVLATPTPPGACPALSAGPAVPSDSGAVPRDAGCVPGSDNAAVGARTHPLPSRFAYHSTRGDAA